MQKWQPDAFAPDISLASGLLCFVWSISVITSIYIQVCFLSTLTSMAVSLCQCSSLEAHTYTQARSSFFSTGTDGVKV